MKSHDFLKVFIFLLGVKTVYASELGEDHPVVKLGRKVAHFFTSPYETLPERSSPAETFNFVKSKVDEANVKKDREKSTSQELIEKLQLQLNNLKENHLTTEDLHRLLAENKSTLEWQKKRYEELEEREIAISKEAFEKEHLSRQLKSSLEETEVLNETLKKQVEDLTKHNEMLADQIQHLKNALHEENLKDALKQIPENVLIEAGAEAMKYGLNNSKERLSKVKDFLNSTTLPLSDEQKEAIVSHLGISEISSKVPDDIVD